MRRLTGTVLGVGGDIAVYREEVRGRLAPFLNGEYTDVTQVEDEIHTVSKLLTAAAERTLPTTNRKKKTWFKDVCLKSVCAQSREARRAWKEAGCPSEGASYEWKADLRHAVWSRVRVCAAREERKRI